MVFGLLTAGATMLCLHVDTALVVSLAEKGGEEPFKIPDDLQILLMFARFVCTFYVMCAFAYFWSVTVCVMHVTGYSMIEYHGKSVSAYGSEAPGN